MKFERKSGILLHPTSLPGTPGIGTIGKPAYDFIDWLSDAGQSLWQILPLGPTGYGDSPYASFSTFAGNPLLIDLDMLVQAGWLSKKDIRPPEYIKSSGKVDFGAVVWWKMPLLQQAALNFLQKPGQEALACYKVFCKSKKNWLEDYALFMSIKSFYDKKAEEEKPASSIWYDWWPKKLALHDAGRRDHRARFEHVLTCLQCEIIAHCIDGADLPCRDRDLHGVKLFAELLCKIRTGDLWKSRIVVDAVRFGQLRAERCTAEQHDPLVAQLRRQRRRNTCGTRSYDRNVVAFHSITCLINQFF